MDLHVIPNQFRKHNPAVGQSSLVMLKKPHFRCQTLLPSLRRAIRGAFGSRRWSAELSWRIWSCML